MSVETFKVAMRSMLNPFVKLLVALDVSPGAITLAGLVITAVAALLLAAGAFLAGAIVLAVAGIFDMTDGMVARASGRAGKFGAVADSVADRYGDAFILLGLLYYYGMGKGSGGAGVGAGGSSGPAVAAYLALAALVGSFLVSYVRARAEGVGLECKVGILERPWRMALLVAGALLGPTAMAVILWPLAILTHVTAIQRVLVVKRQVERANKASGRGGGPGRPSSSTSRAGSEVGAGGEAGGSIDAQAASLAATGRRPDKGFFVTFEGVEGSGKSTQVARVADVLDAKGHEVVVTREPGGTAAGEAIRGLLLGSGDGSIGPEAELLLYMASRAQHVKDVISPALASGAIVLCDRFSDATVAYQAGGRGLSENAIRGLDSVATGGLKPDLTVLLDLAEGEGLARAGRRGGAPDRMEREAGSFHRDVRKAYLDIAQREPHRVKVVDATDSPEALTSRIVLIIEEMLGEGPSGEQRS